MSLDINNDQQVNLIKARLGVLLNEVKLENKPVVISALIQYLQNKSEESLNVTRYANFTFSLSDFDHCQNYFMKVFDLTKLQFKVLWSSYLGSKSNITFHYKQGKLYIDRTPGPMEEIIVGHRLVLAKEIKRIQENKFHDKEKLMIKELKQREELDEMKETIRQLKEAQNFVHVS